MNSIPHGNSRVVAACLSVLLLGVFPPVVNAQTKATLNEARQRMVQDELVDGGIKNERVLRAMGDTPRHEFVALKGFYRWRITICLCRSGRRKRSLARLWLPI